MFAPLHADLSRAHHQRHQRHHAAPLAAQRQSRPDPRAAGCLRQGRHRRHRARSSALAAHADDAGLHERLIADPAREQAAGSPRSIKRETGRHRRPHGAVRRADQAHPRIQAPAAQHPGDDRALRRDPHRALSRLGAAREDFRRQGRLELRHGQGDHQPDQRRRHRREQRHHHARPAEGGVPAELQCQRRRDHHPRGRSSRSRSRPPAWRPRAPAT